MNRSSAFRSRRRSLVGAATIAGLAGLAGLGGCSESGPEVSSWFESEVPAPELEACAEVPSLSDSSARLRIYLGAGVKEQDVAGTITTLRSYAATTRLGLTADKTATRVPNRALFEVSRAELKKILRKKGLSLTDSDPKTAEFVGEVSGRALRTFLLKYAPARRASINIVFLDRIVSPKSPISAYLGQVAGLTFSEFLPDDPAQPAWKLPSHSPTIFISMRALAKVPLAVRRGVLFHELGHAAGLVHQRSPENLMAQQRTGRCLALFDREQTALLRANLKTLAKK